MNIKRGLVWFGLVLACVVFGLLALVATCYLPASVITNNLSRDIDVMVQEGPYPVNTGKTYANIQDNFTDAIMLSMSIPMDTISPLKQSAQSVWWEKPGASSPVESLSLRLSTDIGAESKTYSTYWPGYAVVLRLLLLILSYTQIRIFSAVVLGLLLAANIYLLGRSTYWTAAVSLVLAAIPVSAVVIPQSLQYTTTFALGLLGGLAVHMLLRRWPVRSWDIEFFLVLGCLTAFFDFLTTPIVVWGIPILTLLALEITREVKGMQDRDAKASLIRSGLTIMRSGAGWVAGYVLMWASKWAIAAWQGSDSIWDVAFGKVVERSGATVGLADRLGVLVRNVSMLTSPNSEAALDNIGAPLIWLCVVIAAWFVAVTALGLNYRDMVRYTPILVVGLAPIVWFVFAANHSANHFFFTFRSLYVGVWAIWLFVNISLSTQYASLAIARLKRQRV